MHLLKNIATKKDITINHTASIKEAMKVMYDNKNGCVILLDGRLPIGIITESDIVNSFKSNFSLKDNALKIARTKLLTADENRPVDFAFDMLSQYNIRRIILVDEEKNYAGTILQEDLFNYLEEDVYKVDLKISNIINRSQGVYTIDKKDTIQTVLKKMQSHKIGSLIVTHKDEFVGIITEKDILKLTYNEIDINNKVSKYMTSPVVTIKEDTFVTDTIELMKLKNIRRIVVVNKKNRLLSLLTNRDILKQIKGNYTRILENKIKHAQEIMNFLPEPIIEIYYLNNNDMIHWVNTQAKNIFGEDLIDKKITEIIHQNNWKEIKDTLLDDKDLRNMSIKIDKKTFEVSGTLLKNLETNYIKLLFKDVTNYENQKQQLQKLVEEEIKKRQDSQYLLMQQSKLATMGEMIGHIAHQWRQPLAQLGGILMNLESAYAFKELNKKYLNERIDHGNKLIKYMSKTIEDFRNFFIPTKEKEEFILSECIKNAINIIQASLTYNHITIDFNEKTNHTKILGYPSELSQVILNLLANSQDALLSNNIRTPYINIIIEESNSHIYLSIEDNAGGIKKEIIDKIFDIYFTTKPKKEGTGLGLYMSKLIIETKFEGTISVKNYNNGVVFTLKFLK